MRLLPALLALSCGCALRAATPSPSPAASVAPPVTAAAPPVVAHVPLPAEATASADPMAAPTAAPIVGAPTTAPVQPAVEAAAATAPAAEEGEDDAADEEAGPVAEEGEVHDTVVPEGADGLRYTAELTDAQLEAAWKNAPETLGSISIGFVDEGRMINARQFPAGEAWKVVSPEQAWATQETIDYVVAAINRVRALHPTAPPLRVNQISHQEGGYARPHKSHQSGRDVDLAFYYPTADPVRVREREKYLDVALNWELIKALVTLGDVQMILVDNRVQKVLYDYALRAGENKEWLDSLFHAGYGSMIRHARRHRDHFHVRFYNPKAQELGRRVAPLLAQRPEQNLLMHRVRSGDTLGAIAAKYGSTVDALRKANKIKGSFLRLSQVLKVPLRGPCTHCPVPPPVVVPPRKLPPAVPVVQADPTDATPARLGAAR